MMVEQLRLHEFEYDYDAVFDSDDPDFAEAREAKLAVKASKIVSRRLFHHEPFNDLYSLEESSEELQLYVESSVSLTKTMRQVELKTHSHQSHSLGSEDGHLDDLCSIHTTAENMLTLEDLKNHYSSCFTCGVNWSEDHVSLDCFECGGYAMERPCPVCDGRCKQTWRRDIAMTHSMNKAHWEGECGMPTSEQQACLIKKLVDSNEDTLTEALEDLKTSS